MALPSVEKSCVNQNEWFGHRAHCVCVIKSQKRWQKKRKKKKSIQSPVYFAQSPTGCKCFLCHSLINALSLWLQERSFYNNAVTTEPQTSTWQLSSAGMFRSSLCSNQENTNQKMICMWKCELGFSTRPRCFSSVSVGEQVQYLPCDMPAVIQTEE